MDKIKLRLQGLSEIVGIEDISLLSLVDEGEERQLVVTCDQAMRKEIQMRMMDKREMTFRCPEVMAKLMNARGYQQFEVLISGQVDGEYFTEVWDMMNDHHFQIRCSDGILFALANNCPIYATRRLMLQQSVPYQAGSTKVALPVNVITDEMLEQSLQKAIELENYEMASNLRDELKKRHAHEGE